MKKNRGKTSIFDDMINTHYRPKRRPPQKMQEDPEKPWKWIQTADNEWQRVISQEPIQSDSGGVSGDSDPLQSGYNSVSPDTLSRSLQAEKRTWKVKASRSGIKNRYGVQKIGLSAITTVLAVSGTLLHFDFRVQFILYLVWFGVITISDPLGAFGRFLAFPSRFLIAGCCLSLILFLCRPGIDFAIISGILITGSIFLIRTLNDKWVAADNWLNTAVARKSIEHDPNNLAEKNWQADGRREVKTALSEMGIRTDPDSLDTIHKTAFVIGYAHGLQKTGQIRATETKLSQVQADLAELQNQYDRMETELQNDLRLSKQDGQRAVLKLQEECADLRAENRRILQTNEELIQGLEDQEENVVELPDRQTVEEKVLYARSELGYSYADCGEYAGCSKATAYRIVKDAEDKATA